MMTAINIYPVPRNKCRYKKRETLNVVPVQMGNENIVYAISSISRAHHIIAEIPQAGTGVANDIFIPTLDLDA
jgi:hypothetical protein